MANLRNEFEFRSALLTALGQEHTEAEAKNEDTWRRKMLDGLGVEYNQNDVNQFGLFREKLIEGVTNYSGGGSGGGGSSDLTWVIPEQSVELTKDNATPLSNVGEIVDGDIIVAKVASSQGTFQTYLTGVAKERSSRIIVNLYQDDVVFGAVGQRDGSWVILPNVTAKGDSLFSAVKIKQF